MHSPCPEVVGYSVAMVRLVVAAVLLVSSLVRADSLEDRKYWREKTEMLDSELHEANEECEVEITFEYIDKAEMRAAAEKLKFSPRTVCVPLIKEIARTCRDGDKRKAAVANLCELGGFAASGPIALADLSARVGAGEYRVSAYGFEPRGLRWEVFVQLGEEPS